MISIAYSPPSLEAKVRFSHHLLHLCPSSAPPNGELLADNPPTRVSDPRERRNREKVEGCYGRVGSLLNPTILDPQPPSHSDILTFDLRTRIHDPCPSLSTLGMQSRPVASLQYNKHPHQPSQKQHLYAIHSPTA